MSALAYQTDIVSSFTLRELAQDIQAKRNEAPLSSDEIEKKVEAYKAAYNYHKRENKLDLPPLSTTDKILSEQEEFFREKYERRSKIIPFSTSITPTREREKEIERDRFREIEAERDKLRERLKEVENERDRRGEKIQSIENQVNTYFTEKNKVEVEGVKNILEREKEIAILKKEVESHKREIEREREKTKAVEIEKNKAVEKIDKIENKRHELINAKGEVEMENRKTILSQENEIRLLGEQVEELRETKTLLENEKQAEAIKYQARIKTLEDYNKKWERIEKTSNSEIFLRRYGVALFITVCLIIVQSNEARLFAQLAFEYANITGIWIPYISAFLGFGFQVLGLFLTVNRNKVPKPIELGLDKDGNTLYEKNEKGEIKTVMVYDMTTMQIFCICDFIINLIVLFGNNDVVSFFSFKGMTLICFGLIPPIGIYFSSEILLNILDKKEKLLNVA